MTRVTYLSRILIALITLSFDDPIYFTINPYYDRNYDAGMNQVKRAIDKGEMEPGKLCVGKLKTWLTCIPAELKRLGMIHGDNQMKRLNGYWLISPDRNGGYAYAKVCSNGNPKNIFVTRANIIWNNSFQSWIRRSLVNVYGKSGTVWMEICFEKTVHLRTVFFNGRQWLSTIENQLSSLISTDFAAWNKR